MLETSGTWGLGIQMGLGPRRCPHVTGKKSLNHPHKPTSSLGFAWPLGNLEEISQGLAPGSWKQKLHIHRLEGTAGVLVGPVKVTQHLVAERTPFLDLTEVRGHPNVRVTHSTARTTIRK